MSRWLGNAEAEAGEMNTGSLMLRAGLLAALLLASHFWTSRHLDIGFDSPGPFSGLVVALSGALGVIDKVLEKSEKESAGQKLRQAFRLVLAPPVLIIAFLGAGTTVFGTIDRQYVRAAGAVGFTAPDPIGPTARLAYDRLLHHRPYRAEMVRFGHPGSHTGWASPAFVQHYLVPIIMEQGEAVGVSVH